MKRRFTYAAAGGVLFTLACGPKVEIGHGTAGASSGGSGDSPSGDGSGGTYPLPQGGSLVFTTAGDAAIGGATETGGSASTIGAGGADSTVTGPSPSLVGAPGPVDNGPQAAVGKVDLLLAVDNSISMAEKQQLFAQTVPALVTRLISPYCVSATGAVVSRPPSPGTVCPAGSNREFAPLGDLHVGVITSSLGSHGASGMKDVCVTAEDDDHAHLLPFVRNNVESYDGKGYLNWDPQGLSSPPGESDVQAFTLSLQNMIKSVGEHGCGYEATLEAAYRFLVDPAPPKSVALPMGETLAAKVGTDTELLQERANFLRPDSSVVVLTLTDENDCSIQDEGYGWLIAHAQPMFRSTSACHANPNATCCQSCAESQPNPGCLPFNQDSECKKGNTLAQTEDDLNLRCFNQKGRFGFDLLYPTARYVNGFSGGAVPNRAGTLVANPLFHQNGVDRDPSLFTLAVIAGVPWQDLATTASLNGPIEYQTPSQLTANGRWAMLLGDPATNTPPGDPFMRESTDARSGKNPVTGASIVAASSTDPQANPINGHEQLTLNADLQYACTFELPTPLLCDAAADNANLGCDCYAYSAMNMNPPVCNPPGGGPAGITQYYGKAYPGLRELTVAKELGRRSVVGSICAPNTKDETRPDYGYGPVFGALGQRLATTLVKP